MYYGFCNNSDEHQKEGREDFERRGRYGYDSWKYGDSFNDCNRAYTDGFDEARREDDRRQEIRDEEYRQEQREIQRASERRQMIQDMEDDYWDQAYNHPQQPGPPQQEFPEEDHLPY